jgi:hypothetical protein
VLSWTGKGRWDAISGPFGHGELPKGLYVVSRREITPYSSNIGAGYQDQNGKGFFIPIYPQFETFRGQNGRLGIHPDGSVKGTKGCIGIRSNAKTFYDVIAATATDSKLTLEVMD